MVHPTNGPRLLTAADTRDTTTRVPTRERTGGHKGICQRSKSCTVGGERSGTTVPRPEGHPYRRWSERRYSGF